MSNFKITISHDDMKAWLYFYTDIPVVLSILQDFIADAGIVYGLDEFLLEDLAEAHEPEKPYCIATGSLPDEGLKYSFLLNPSTAPKRFSGGRVDFYNLGTIQNVTENQCLVTIVPPESRQPGYTVKGECIPPSSQATQLPQLGSHVTLSDDGQSLIALAHGYPTLDNGILSVEPTYTVEGDVDFSVGHLDCSGHVVVMGDVKSGFKIRGAQHVTVHGVVEGGSIDAGGKVVLYSNVFGKHRSRIESADSVECLYLDAARVSARKDIVLMRGALHCDLYAGGSVLVKGYEGQLIGGTIRAHGRILTHNLGSESAIPTEVEIFPGTYDTTVATRYLTYFNALIEDDYTFVNQAFDWKTSSGQRDQIRDALRQCHNAVDVLAAYIDTHRRLLPIRPLQIGTIVVTGTIYPGVNITISDASMLVREPLTGVMVYKADDGLQITALETSTSCS